MSIGTSGGVSGTAGLTATSPGGNGAIGITPTQPLTSTPTGLTPTTEASTASTPSVAGTNPVLTVDQAITAFPDVGSATIQSLAGTGGAPAGELSAANVGYLYRLEANLSGVNPLGIDTMNGLNDASLGNDVINSYLAGTLSFASPAAAAISAAAGALSSAGTLTLPAGSTCPSGYTTTAPGAVSTPTLSTRIATALQGATQFAAGTTLEQAPSASMGLAQPVATGEAVKLEVYNVLTYDVTLTVAVRILTSAGEISNAVTILTVPAATGNMQGVGTVNIPLTDGYLLGVTITYGGVILSAGAVWAQAGIALAGGSGPIVVPLFADYLSDYPLLGWPGARQREVGEGPGVLNTYFSTTVRTPPYTLQIPSGGYNSFDSITVTCQAAAGSPGLTVGLGFYGGSDKRFGPIVSTYSQAGGSTFNWLFAPGIAAIANTVTNQVQVPIPPLTKFGAPQFNIVIDTFPRTAGDQFTAINFASRSWAAPATY